MQTRRAFLVAIDKLWLPRVPFNGTNALTRFLRERLLPQHYAAVFATTDHEQVAAVVERLQQYQDSIGFESERYYQLNRLHGRPIPASPARASRRWTSPSSAVTRGKTPSGRRARRST